MNIFPVRKGMLLRKDAPKGFKKGDRLELGVGFSPATHEEMTKALGSADIPEGYIAGWASTAGRDHYNHEVKGGAFQEAMDTRKLTGPMGIKLLMDHDWKKPAGVIKVLEYRRDRLWMEAQMNLDVSYVKERWHMLKMMGGANFSVGFMLQDYEVVIREDDGDEDYYLSITRGDLFEVSIVLFPGNDECQMTFVKAALSEDNPSDDKLFFAKTQKSKWAMGASKNLPAVSAVGDFDVAAAKARVFKAAGFDTDKPDFAIARKAFLSFDAANPELRGSYKMLIADVIDGKLQVSEAAVNLALSRLETAGLPDDVKLQAKSVLEHYQEQTMQALVSTKSAPSSLSEFEKALVARGLAKSRNDARAIALLVKSCPELFAKKLEDIRPPEPALDAGLLTETLLSIKRLNASIAPVATS